MTTEKEKFVLELSEAECERIRERAEALSRAAETNETWGREEQLSATTRAISGDTGRCAYYLIRNEIDTDLSPDVDEYGKPV